MIHKVLANKAVARSGGFTDLFIIGTTRNSGGTDFTAAATQQTYNLLALNIGDIVMAPFMILEVKTNALGTSVTAATGSVGVTSALTQFTAAANLLVAGNEFFTCPNTVTPYPTVAASIYLTFDLNTTGANVSVLSTGEFWIWANISRVKDRITDRVV
jgi:hypothetical protein